MVKIALRVTRRLSKARGRSRSPRSKTFSTEESAHTWAKAQGFKEYELDNIKSDSAIVKKIRVVAFV